MSDLELPARPAGLPAEISDSLAIVWKRYAGRRPTDVETVVSGSRIACVLRESVRGFDQAMAEGEDDGGTDPTPARTLAGYKRDAVEAVARVTRRRVMAFVSDHNADTDVAKEVFILEQPPRRRASLFIDHRLDPRPPTRGER
jgi:uncharacterized protein YbcI